MQRKTGFKSKSAAAGLGPAGFGPATSGMTRSGGLSASGNAARLQPSPFEAERKASQRAALNALKRARREADKAGIPLSDWEGEFLNSVGERIQEHGRAFGDPELGRPGQALSTMQGRKLKEIAAKARGEHPNRRWGKKPPPVGPPQDPTD